VADNTLLEDITIFVDVICANAAPPAPQPKAKTAAKAASAPGLHRLK
jgi:hypothetical protein